MPMPTLTVNGGWWQFTPYLRDNVDFRTHGALRGAAKAIGEGVPFGRLPVEYRTMSLYDAVYVVYSYGTPIAWKAFGIWHMPDVRYSVTTSKHQGRIGTAVAELQREAAPAPAPVARSPYCTRCSNTRMGCVDARCPGDRTPVAGAA